MIAGLDPVIVEIGPLAVRWYGVLMAVSIAWGFYYFRRDGLKLGYSEDFLYNAAALAVAGGIAGARLVYVATNWDVYAGSWISILRVDQGGLSFHGAILGGICALSLYVWRKGYSLEELLDLVVPGVCIGIILVRIGNLINGEVLGRTTGLAWWFERHPAQLVGSAIGAVLLVIHNTLARRRRAVGYLFWSFILYYSLLRGIVEESIRLNPLYAWGYVNERWGVGFFTLTQILTPFFVAAAWAMRKRALSLDRRPRGPKVPAGGRRP